MSVAITEKTGNYGAVIVSGENSKIDPAALTLPEGCCIVLAQNEVDPGLLSHLSRLTRAGTAKLWLNAAPATGLSPEALRLVDVLIVNRLEAADLVGATPGQLSGDALLEALQSVAPQARILVTLGAGGVAHAAAGGAVEHFAADAVEVISTHGAGDMFVGSLAAGVLRGDGWPAAIRFAQSKAAALISTPR
jgi:ribokinase